MEREKEHLRTAQGYPSFLVSLILSYSKESVEVGKDVPVGSEVLGRCGSHPEAQSSRFPARVPIAHEPCLSLPASL